MAADIQEVKSNVGFVELEDIQAVAPETGTGMIFPGKSDAELVGRMLGE